MPCFFITFETAGTPYHSGTQICSVSEVNDGATNNPRCCYLYAMSTTKLPEVWLRGPVPGISPILQPAVHALLQARDEINELMSQFPPDKIWERPAGVASAAFHLQHIRGVLDRLFTYAEGKLLSPEQLSQLKEEGKHVENGPTLQSLLDSLNRQVDESVEKMKRMEDRLLTEERAVGRAQLPSTVLGLLFHAAEHTMRHNGQLLVTVKVVLGG
jgi:uncharacterized damage-inducible protein DinB